MRKTLKNRSIDFPPSAVAAERLADYKGEGNPLGKLNGSNLWIFTYKAF